MVHMLLVEDQKERKEKVTNLETGEVEKYAKGGLVKKGIARGCGKVMSNRRKTTKYF
jgi:hypothetical protein